MVVEGARLWLRLATCCARIAGLFALRAFVGLADGGDSYLAATEGHRNVSFGKGLLLLPRGSPGGLSSPSHPLHFPLPAKLFCLFLPHFLFCSPYFCLLNPLSSF
jgi:hypothetical protein